LNKFLKIGIIIVLVVVGGIGVYIFFQKQTVFPGIYASPVGTYVNEFDSNQFLVLHEDKTFHLKERGIDFYGKWKIEGETLFLYAEKMISSGVELPLYKTEKAKIQGNTIIDDDGIKWIKQR